MSTPSRTEATTPAAVEQGRPSVLPKSVLWLTALGIAWVLVAIHRVHISQGTVFDAELDGRAVLAPVADVRSLLSYGGGVLVIGALCYWAAIPRTDVNGELRAELKALQARLDLLAADVDGMVDAVTAPAAGNGAESHDLL